MDKAAMLTPIRRTVRNRPTAFRLGATAACIVLASCASGGSGGNNSPGPYNVLTASQLRDTSTQSVYDAIRRLRPQWLRVRGRTSINAVGPDEPIVYVDGARYGSLNDLGRMDVNQVTRAEFVDPLEATTRFGINHTGGAILIFLGP